MMKRIVAVLLSLCLGMAFFVDSARAHLRWYYPWAVEFEEYGRVFIMNPFPGSTCLCCAELFGEERMVVPSGLYYNTGSWANIVMAMQPFGMWYVERCGEDPVRIPSNNDSLVNIYYFDYWLNSRQVYFSMDGRYFVGVFRHASIYHTSGQEALRFYADGEVVKRYRVVDFLDDVDALLARRRPEWQDWVIWTDLLDHDQSRGILSFETVEDNSFAFDITTGEIIDLPPPY